VIVGFLEQLFHGNADTQTVFYWAGTNANGRLAYLSDINNRDVRSEGMSYGMMIAVQLDKKAEFDALWNWSRTFMFHDDPAHPEVIHTVRGVGFRVPASQPLVDERGTADR
jgi:hypothetical protein